MKSTTAQQGSWKTKDGSAWWLRDAKYNEPNGNYHANCYLHIYDVNPNNVRFDDNNCNFYTTDYLCQPLKKAGGGGNGAKLTVARLTKKNSGYGGDQTNAIPGRRLVFKKKMGNSVVKVQYAESLRVYGNGKWCRWTIKIDNKDCKPTVYNTKHTSSTGDNDHTPHAIVAGPTAGCLHSTKGQAVPRSVSRGARTCACGQATIEAAPGVIGSSGSTAGRARFRA